MVSMRTQPLAKRVLEDGDREFMQFLSSIHLNSFVKP